MALYPDIKAMALYSNESFGKNFLKNCFIQAMLNSLSREKENMHCIIGQRVGNRCLEACCNRWTHIEIFVTKQCLTKSFAQWKQKCLKMKHKWTYEWFKSFTQSVILLLGETLSNEIFVTFQKICHFRPTKFCPIRHLPHFLDIYHSDMHVFILLNICFLNTYRSYSIY